MEVKELSEQLNRVHEEFKRLNNDADAERKKFGDELGETKERLTKLQDGLDKIEESISKKLARLRGPSAGTSIEPADEKAEKRSAVFQKFLRKGEQQLSPEESKDLSASSDPDGGFTVRPEVSNRLIELLRERSPIRELASVQSISGPSLEMLREKSGDMTYGWVSETGSRAATTTPQFEKLSIPAHEMYAFPQATQTLLDDSGINVESWLLNRAYELFDRIERTAFVSGNGVNKPLGITDLSNGISLVAGGGASALTADGVIDLMYDLPDTYAKKAVAIMRRSTVRAIRKLKDSQNQYLWQPGLAGTNPATICDVSYREAIDMPAVGTNTYPIVVGDWSYYQIVDRQGLRVVRDALTNKPFVGFYVTRRVGGQCILPEAFRMLKVATSV